MRCDRYVLDAAGNPVEEPDIHVWGRWFESRGERTDWIVAKDMVGAVQISTVFLGLDHGFLGIGPPVLWETLVFGGPLDGEMCRYVSRAAAVAGHEEMVWRVKMAAGPEDTKA